VTTNGGLAGRVSGGLGANYWRLWGSSGASNLADGVFWIAFPLLAIQLTDSPALIAGVTVVGRLPWLVFVLFAGALADRLDRRRTMVSVNVLRTGVAAALAVGVAAGVVNLPVLYVAAFVLGLGETLFDTAAQSIMPNVVERDQLSRANGRLYAVELVMNQFVGPPLGGLLAGAAVALAFAGSALAFAFAALALVLLSGSFRPVRVGPRTSIVADIRVGLRYLLGHRLLRTLAIMVGVMNLASSAAFAIFVLYAVDPGPMGLDAVGFGILSTAMAVGSVAGSLVVHRAERRLGRARLLGTTVVVSAVTIAMPGLTASPWVVGASFAVTGVAVMMWNVVTVSLRQRIVPDHLLGRVNASYRLLAWGSQPIGALLGGLVGEVLGLQAVFVLAGLGTLTLVLALRIVTDAAIAAAEREGDARAEADARAAAGDPGGSGAPGGVDARPGGGTPAEA
jgi:MFS family permease